MKNEEYFHRTDFKNFMTPEQITELMRKHSVLKRKYFRNEESKRKTAAQNDVSVHNNELWFNSNQRMVQHLLDFNFEPAGDE